MSSGQPRKPAGTPAGGEFANKTGSSPASDLSPWSDGDEWEPATLAQASAVARISSVLSSLNLDNDEEAATTASDLIANVLHWGWANTPNRHADFDPDDIFERARNHFTAELDGDDDLANDPSYLDSERDAIETRQILDDALAMRQQASECLNMLQAVAERGGWKVISVDGNGIGGAWPTRLHIERKDGTTLVVGYISDHGFDVTDGYGDEVLGAWWGDSDDADLMDEASDAYFRLDDLCSNYGQFGLRQVNNLLSRGRS